MRYYLKHIKNFKCWGKGLKLMFIIALIRNLVLILAGVGLYLWLNNTGLLLYSILMIKYHWMMENES